MLTSQKTQQWQGIFVDRIYQLCNQVHPGMSIDREAVSHIRLIITNILKELLDSNKPASLAELEKNVHVLLPQQATGIIKEAHEFINAWPPKKSHRNYNTANVKTMCELNSKLVLIIKEYLGLNKEKKDREKEIEKMALFLLSLCDYLTDDMLKWAGHYVKNVRNVTMSISLQNLQIALNADKNLMELTEIVHNGEEDGEGMSVAGTTLLFDFEMNADEERHQREVEADYGKLAREFLHYESQYVNTLSLLVNVFKRRMESACGGLSVDYPDEIFGNVNELHELSLQVERCLEDAIEMCDTPSVGTILWQLAEGHDFDCYIDFLETITTTTQGAIEKALKEKGLQSYFDNEEKVYSSQADGQTYHLIVRYVLPSLLNSPIVHFYRTVEFIKRLWMISNCLEDRNDLENILGYFNPLVAKMENLLNTELRRLIKLDRDQRQLNESPISQRLERLQQIQKRIEGYEGKNIGQTCSELVKEGSLQMVRPSLSMQPLDTLRRGRNRILTERYLYVFDQLVVLCKSHKNGVKFKERVNIRKTEMRDVEDNDEMRNAFRLETLDKGVNVLQVYTFICKCKADKDGWMSVLMNLQTKSILDRLLDNYTREEKKRIPLVVPDSDQYRFAEPDTEENIMFEDYTSSSGVPVVKKGTVPKLVERLTFHLYTDNNYVKTFLISYRSFCQPAELLSLLIERFEVPVPAKLQPQSAEIRPGGPLAGRYDTVQSHGLSSPPTPFIHSGAVSEQSFQRFRKEYERPIQRRVLSVMQQWVKVHWYDFENDPFLLETMVNFLKRSCDTPGKLTNQHRKFAKIILATVDKKRNSSFGNSGSGMTPGHTNNGFELDEPGVIPPTSPSTPNVNSFQKKPPETLWHVAQKGDTANYDLLTLHPLEIGRQLTLLHFDLFRAIKPIELVESAWMREDKRQRSPQLLKLIDHSNNLTYWLARSIVDTDSLEERVALLERSLEVMCVFEELHNFTGLVSFYAALNSSYMIRLSWCWERLEAQHKMTFSRFQKLCEDKWREMVKRLQSVDPPCIPFFGHYMDHIYKVDLANKTLIKPTGMGNSKREENGLPTSPTANKMLVSFLKCRRIAALIGEIQMYQNQPYVLTVEPSIRQFFETIAPREGFKDDDGLDDYLHERSKKLQPKDGPKPPDVKPRHPPHVLRSPGIKPPKGNHYAREHPASAHLVPTTPSPRDYDGSKPSPSMTGPSSKTNQEDFAIIDINPGQQPRYIGDVTRRQAPTTSNFPLGPVPKKAPPPLHPRKTRQPVSNGPPIRSPSVFTPLSANWKPPAPSPPELANKSPRLNQHAQAFIFPEIPFPSGSPTPQRPAKAPAPLRPQATASTSAEHRVTLPVPGSPSGDSPSVSVSLPPPSLPPRVSRPGSASTPPPPRPPKPGHMTSSPLATPRSLAPSTTSVSTNAKSVSSSQSAESPPPPPSSNPEHYSPPPLPPKTYKSRRQSSSPTN